MTVEKILSQHHEICGELHALALDENRHLRLHQCAPNAEYADRKRELLQKLDKSLAALQTLPADSNPERKELIEKTRDKTLQIMELNRENEQLLLRCSLARSETKQPAMPTAMLQNVYGRTK